MKQQELTAVDEIQTLKETGRMLALAHEQALANQVSHRPAPEIFKLLLSRQLKTFRPFSFLGL